MSKKERQLLAVGTIVKPYGVKGEIVVQPMTDDPQRFERLRCVWLGADSQSVNEVRIEKATIESRGVRLKLEGINDRSAAEKLRHRILFVDRAHAVRLPRGRYFIHDVIGLVVCDQHGKELGTVEDVLHYPASDVYVVRGNGREVMVPAVKEFVTAIDITARTMTVHLIDGMME